VLSSALAASAAVGVLLTACSSSATHQTGAGTGASPLSAAAAGGSASGTSTNAVVANADAFLSHYRAAPTGLSVTTPVSSPPAAGKTVVYLQCDAAQCKETADAFALAVKAAGWTLKVLDFQTANPATLVAAMKQALQYHPVGVAFQAVPYAAWASEVPAYEAAHVAIVPAYVGATPLNSALVANIGGPADITLAAKIIANWFIGDSGGDGKALLYSVPDFPALAEYQQAFTQAVSAGCPDCSVKVVTQTVAQVLSGGENAAVVAALQRDPSLTYVVMGDYPLTVGLPAALKAAGISGKKIAGSYAGNADETLIKQGAEAAGTPQPLNIGAWLTVDALIRHSESLPIAVGDGGLVTQLLTPSTVTDPSDSYDYPTDYQQLFKKLWDLG
jgi:ribose transport system substrate-binding protein